MVDFGSSLGGRKAGAWIIGEGRRRRRIDEAYPGVEIACYYREGMVAK